MPTAQEELILYARDLRHVLGVERRQRDLLQQSYLAHTVIGERMLQDVALLAGEPLRIVRSHHERWDGGGDPDALAGDEIPVAARVFALADALDAMTTNRPYRWARSWEAAHAEIAAEAGRQFDPGVVQAFVKNESELRRIRRGLAAA